MGLYRSCASKISVNPFSLARRMAAAAVWFASVVTLFARLCPFSDLPRLYLPRLYLPGLYLPQAWLQRLSWRPSDIRRALCGTAFQLLPAGVRPERRRFGMRRWRRGRRLPCAGRHRRRALCRRPIRARIRCATQTSWRTPELVSPRITQWRKSKKLD